MSIRKMLLAAAATLVILGTSAPVFASDVGGRHQLQGAARSGSTDTGQRHGYYSYAPSDALDDTSGPPWLDPEQSSGGPFDSGFFFDSGMGPDGGNAPYQH